MRIVLTAILLLPLPALAETFVIDFVKVLNGNEEEALYYYENNWTQHRIAASKQGFISSYRLMVKNSEDGETDILLITGYATDDQFENREANFDQVMEESRKAGLKLLNDKQPAEFREVWDSAIYVND